MIKWYAFEPVDTLFFKGATPMKAGLDHTAASIFPPRPSTIQGALRTLVLRQNNISIKDYYSNSGTAMEIIEAIGPADKNAPFHVIGPVFTINGRSVIPAPYTWYIEDSKELEDKHEGKEKELRIYKSCSINDLELGNIRINTSAKESQRWACSQDANLKPMGGMWISADLIVFPIDGPITLYNKKESPSADTPFIINDMNILYVSEPHTGIALEENYRVAKKGHLYSFTHYRLMPGVQIVFGIDRDLPIDKEGVLQLGGEKKFGPYSQIEDINLHQGGSGLFMSLSPVGAKKEYTDALVATGKTIYAGGWDMKKGFHKPLKGYYPSGSVFNSQIRTDSIQI